MAAPALAADLPQVKLGAGNEVPACATPGRLTAYLKARNPRLDHRYETLATLYMRHGQELGIRWDVAFFQMILETAALRYTGDVRADQNNFAGLGASGGGVRGERFRDMSSGVKAHLQHLLMYAGEHIDDPVADRTRKVQEWGVLTDWQKSIEGPMTYTLVAKQWAPTSRNYARDITAIADGFYNEYCSGSDPAPQMQQEALDDDAGDSRQAKTKVAVAEPPVTLEPPPAASEPPVVESRPEAPLKGFGAGFVGAAAAGTPDRQRGGDAPAKGDAPVKKADAGKQPPSKPTASPPAKTPADEGKGASVQTASLGGVTQLKIPPAKSSSSKCKVWTASYGGQRAVIIKADASGTVNYTVLDVTDTNEKREVDAYIAAYAKGGESIGSFATQTKALNKAFELCPEG